MARKSSTANVSKVSSSSALSKNSAGQATNRSSIIHSVFAPSYLQLHLFATIIQSFDSSQLRVFDINTNRLKYAHTTTPGTNVTCLDWGCYGRAYRELRQSSKKKRKRQHDSGEDVVVAYGTNHGTVEMYSPSENKIAGTLKGGHSKNVTDFKFLEADNLKAWSIGDDAKLVQWDLKTDTIVRTINIPDTATQKLGPISKTIPQILCASQSPMAIELDGETEPKIISFDAFKHTVTTLTRPDSKSDEDVFIAADDDRYLNLYSIPKRKIVRTLNTSSGVETVAVSHTIDKMTSNQVLAVTTKEGTIDLFSAPFSAASSMNGDIKSSRKNLTRKADATIKLISTDGKPVSAFSSHFLDTELVIASIDSGIEPSFQKLQCLDPSSRGLILSGVTSIEKIKTASTLNTATTNGVKQMGEVHINESKAVVTNGVAAPQNVVANRIEDSEEDSTAAKVQEIASTTDDESDAVMEDVDEPVANGLLAEDEDEEKMADEELTFGERIKIRQQQQTISIMDALPVGKSAVVQAPSVKQMILPSGMSLGTVLTQSLRTNDQSLLETCLHVTDEQIIQNTILCLDSSLASSLLIKLAERLADRPGRYGHLLTWVQSTMIAHGGAIAGQANVASKLRTLYQVLDQRSRVLPSVLLLKGKLEMMSAQQSFRQQAEAAGGSANRHRPATIFIEGQTENWESSEDEVDDLPVRAKNQNAKPRKDITELLAEQEDSEDDDMPTANGVESATEDEAEYDEEALQEPKTNGIIDSEAEVSGADEDVDGLDSEDEDLEEDDEDEDEEDSEMDDFINDGEIELEDDDGFLDDDMPEKPAKKKSKRS